MIRGLVNLILTIAYLAGLLLLWAGFEDLTARNASLAAPLIEIGVAIVWWDLLTIVGRWVSTHHGDEVPHAEGAGSRRPSEASGSAPQSSSCSSSSSTPLPTADERSRTRTRTTTRTIEDETHTPQEQGGTQ
jgi:hypothetical protein